MDVSEFQQIRADIARLKRTAERAAGARGELLKSLKKFGAVTVEEAKGKLEAMEKELKEKEKEYQEALDVYDAKWGDSLEPGKE